MKKQKSTYRFNFVDVLLILLVVGVIGGVYYFISGKNSTNAGFGNAAKQKVEYVIEIKTLDKDFVDKINVGDKVYETVKHGFIGTVKDIEIAPAWSITTNDLTGETMITEYPPINLPEVKEDTDTLEAEESDYLDENEGSEDAADTDSESGAVFEEPIYDFYNARITIEAELDFAGNVYSVGSYEIGIGRMIYFRVPHYVGSAYCIALNVVE